MSKEVKAYEGPSVSLKEVLQLMQNCFQAEKDSPGVRQVPFLLGPPGIGKTALASQLVALMDAQDREEGGPGWELLSFRLNQSDPTDLKGIPTAAEIDGQKVCSFAGPGVFPYAGYPKSAEGKKKLIFLDELAQAPPSMQALGANIIDGRIGDYDLDIARTMIMGASNRKGDGAATFTIPRNVVSRVCWINVRPRFEDWEEWAIEANIHPAILGFLSNNRALFNETVQEDMQPFCTPRGWHKVSTYMHSQGEAWYRDAEVSLAHLYGTIGKSAAQHFWASAKTMHTHLRIEDIASGKNPPPPAEDRAMALYIVTRALLSLVREWPDILIKKGFDLLDLDGQAKEIGQALGNDIERFKNIFTWLVSDKPDDNVWIVLFTKWLDKRTGNLVFNLLANHPNLEDAWKTYSDIRSKI